MPNVFFPADRLRRIGDELESLYSVQDNHPGPFDNVAIAQLIREAIALGAFSGPEYADLRATSRGHKTVGTWGGEEFPAIIAGIVATSDRIGRPVDADDFPEVYAHLVREVRSAADQHALTYVTEEDWAILTSLAKASPRLLTQEQIEGAIPGLAVALRTIQKRLPILVEKGLVCQPEGKRSGYGATCAGLELANPRK